MMKRINGGGVLIKLLLVEDNVHLSKNITEYLQKEFAITVVFDGEEAISYIDTNDFDVIILDLMLPKVSGMDILPHIRKERKNVGVIILTSKEELSEKLRAFDLGANDYMTKPFYMEELKARIYLILKSIGKITDNDNITFKDLFLDHRKLKCFIYYDGLYNEIELTDKQYKLLEYLLMNKGQILLKDQIFDRVWGFESDALIPIIEVYIFKLRKLLAPYGYDKYIVNKRSVGYMIDENG